MIELFKLVKLNSDKLSAIISVSVTDFPYKAKQQDLKEFSRKTFGNDFDDIDRILASFDNTMIEFRNLCVPIIYFSEQRTFRERNELYVDICLKYAEEAIEKCINEAGVRRSEITDFIFVSSTGISTPSIDALLINKMKLNPNISRIPVWGLGCAGGVSGLAKASVIATANPNAKVLIVAAELCSLTFLKEDISKSNLIATGLFSDGIAAVMMTGDEANTDIKKGIRIKNYRSRLYYDSLDVMGWEVLETGFKVVFSKDIPAIVNNNVRDEVMDFLEMNSLGITDISNFIVHPGGKKIIEAYVSALGIEPEMLNKSKDILKNYGNMSSASVLYVLNEFMRKGYEDGPGLMISLGPGFSSELLLLDMKN